MKPFIYLSVLLITAGSAFGLSDYFKAKKDGTIAKLYKEEDTPELPIAVEQPAIAGNVTAPVVMDTKTAVTSEAATKKVAAAKKIKKVSKAKKISFKIFSRAEPPIRFEPPIIEEPVKETPVAVPAVAEEPVKPEVKDIQPVKIEPVKIKKRSLTKMFSRSRPRQVEKIEVKPVE